MPIIEVNHVSKEFRLGQITTLRGNLMRLGARVMGRPVAARPRFLALDDISFKVEPGEVLGIIGTNGAGKSTLLKLLAGITVPSSGSMIVRETTAPLIEVGAGLIADLTGRENIYLNGIILGMSYRQIKRKVDEIVEFAELEEFIDTPIKRYSSGMHVRLGFSIATSVDAEILIVDEVLAVGDLAFQRKCFDRIEEMIKRQNKTILLVSHNTRQVERLCTRVLLLDHGHIIADGDAEQVCEQFYERSDEKIRQATQSTGSTQWANTQTSDGLQVQEIALVDARGCVTNKVDYKHDVGVRIRFRAARELRTPTFTVGVHTTDFLYLSTHTSAAELDSVPPGEYEIVCKIFQFPLLPGVYGLRMGIAEGSAGSTAFYGENLVHFQVMRNADAPTITIGGGHGFVALDASWGAPTPRTQTEEFMGVRSAYSVDA